MTDQSRRWLFRALATGSIGSMNAAFMPCTSGFRFLRTPFWGIVTPGRGGLLVFRRRPRFRRLERVYSFLKVCFEIYGGKPFEHTFSRRFIPEIVRHELPVLRMLCQTRSHHPHEEFEEKSWRTSTWLNCGKTLQPAASICNILSLEAEIMTMSLAGFEVSGLISYLTN
jgi:hypothetical protein